MTKEEAQSRKSLSLDDLKSMREEMLTPRIAAKYLGCTPYSLNVIAKQQPQLLGFPFTFTGRKGSWLRIPRRAFIAWAEGRNE